MRYCRRCQQTKPLSEFNKDRRRKDGCQQYCRLCHRQHIDAYRKSEHGKAYARKYYQEHRETMQANSRRSRLKLRSKTTPSKVTLSEKAQAIIDLLMNDPLLDQLSVSISVMLSQIATAVPNHADAMVDGQPTSARSR